MGSGMDSNSFDEKEPESEPESLFQESSQADPISVSETPCRWRKPGARPSFVRRSEESSEISPNNGRHQ